MRNTQKLTLTAMMVAIGTLTSHMLFIPLGIVKVFPVQHFINILSAVLLGPYYALAQAIGISLLRNLFGTGSVFAFPGSMIGALLAAYLYQKTKKIGFAFAGEVVGTGIIGAIASYPIAVLLLGNEAAVFGFIPAFLASSLAGATLGFVLLKIFLKNAGGSIEMTSKL
ncbi:energy coupling factor transporter S component ThiW [Mesobacillus selenatarsenatis]|uniref:Substrate-specific component ThiW of predicted thiazole ECF transporter n=1 Tax=Mesobacillus selenatarsenatis (strain DSM 18680 / JCM 14380 / FERM P-15431 / SF-1) TaxID=1321606 RepID=A0A0A8X7I8_MESS1|nr:energy coupling factor transporter S component ThiW [Mesobacillus selenatarsenatis]GAM14131.1 substrate-specific component ThiW of predicted thiazole ECF transporter [Mesobacillus selenatarsenatis SF-1]